MCYMKPDNIIINFAVQAGRQSPCCKSQRGVVIYNHDNGVVNYVMGWNHPPEPFTCTGTESCKKNCGKICVHAEQHAILNCLEKAKRQHTAINIVGAEMLHIKVVDGEGVSGGPPSCPDCSKLILEAGIAYMWLWETDGWKRYTAEEFHRITLQNCGML